MVDGPTVGVVLGLLMLQGTLVAFFFTRRSKAAAGHTPSAPPEREATLSRIRGSLVMPAGLAVKGTVELDGDVVLRPGGAAAEDEFIELDVPTPHVDRVLTAFQEVGFDARDTGLTVDTDEGEETLTTLRLGIRSLGTPREGRTRDVLRVHGNVTVEPGAEVACSLEADGRVFLGDAVRVHGGVRGGGPVQIGAGVVVEGEVESSQDIDVGAGSRALSIRTERDVRFLLGFPAPTQRVSARRIHVGPAREGSAK